MLEYEEQIKNTIAKYIDIKSNCLSAIEQLPNITEKLILRLKYINGKKHEDIAEIIGYSLIQEKRMCESALKNFKIPQS